MTHLFQGFECQTCVSDWRGYKRQVEATLPGDTAPDWPKKDCEKSDCPLGDAMLDRLEQQEGMGQLAMRLRSLRTAMQRPDYQQRRKEWQQEQEAAEERMRLLDVPMTGTAWNHLVPEEVAEVLENFDDDRPAWVRLGTGWRQARAAKKHAVALWGPSRSGKTCAAAHWLRSISGGRFVTAAHLFSLRDAMATGHDRTELEVVKRAPALVIDDLDRGAVRDADLARIAEVVRARESNGLPTVLTMLSSKRLPASLVKRVQQTSTAPT